MKNENTILNSELEPAMLKAITRINVGIIRVEQQISYWNARAEEYRSINEAISVANCNNIVRMMHDKITDYIERKLRYRECLRKRGIIA